MRKSKEEIVIEMAGSFDLLCTTCQSVSDELFNQSREGKWTPAENLQHIISATKITALAFRLPKVVPVLLYGKPARTSHVYGKVVDNYLKRLESGAKASGMYVPKKSNYNKNSLVDKLSSEGEKLITAIQSKWSDEQLDHYQVSHPILGLLTHRELAYFTIYHNGHHMETIRRYYL